MAAMEIVKRLLVNLYTQKDDSDNDNGNDGEGMALDISSSLLIEDVADVLHVELSQLIELLSDILYGIKEMRLNRGRVSSSSSDVHSQGQSQSRPQPQKKRRVQGASQTFENMHLDDSADELDSMEDIPDVPEYRELKGCKAMYRDKEFYRCGRVYFTPRRVRYSDALQEPTRLPCKLRRVCEGVMFPWLSQGSGEWHPFSTYLREETEEGLCEVFNNNTDSSDDASNLDYGDNNTRVENPMHDVFGVDCTCSHDSKPIDIPKTALVLAGIQNAFAHKDGTLHTKVADVMTSTDMLIKTLDLADFARFVGAHVFHVPNFAATSDEKLDDSKEHDIESGGADNDGTKGPVADQTTSPQDSEPRHGYFQEGSWEAAIVDCHKPMPSDTVITGKTKLDTMQWQKDTLRRLTAYDESVEKGIKRLYKEMIQKYV